MLRNARVTAFTVKRKPIWERNKTNPPTIRIKIHTILHRIYSLFASGKSLWPT